MALRELMGREASPSAAVLDGQSIKSAEKGAVTTTRWVTTPARAARSAPWATTKGCRCGSLSTPPRIRTATGPVWSSTRYAAAPLARPDLGRSRLAWQVDAAAKVPPLCLEVVKRRDDMKGLSSYRAVGGRAQHLCLVRPQSASRQELENRRNPGHLRYPRLGTPRRRSANGS